MKLPSFALPGLLVAVLSIAPLHADDDAFAALVLATNEADDRPTPKKLEPFVDDLSRIFGYNTFYLLGSDQEDIFEGAEEWFVPSDQFFIKTTILERLEAHYRVKVELYQKRKKVLEVEAKLAMNAPLYIRGPQWGKGQLIMLFSIID